MHRCFGFHLGLVNLRVAGSSAALGCGREHVDCGDSNIVPVGVVAVVVDVVVVVPGKQVLDGVAKVVVDLVACGCCTSAGAGSSCCSGCSGCRTCGCRRKSVVNKVEKVQITERVVDGGAGCACGRIEVEKRAGSLVVAAAAAGCALVTLLAVGGGGGECLVVVVLKGGGICGWRNYMEGCCRVVRE